MAAGPILYVGDDICHRIPVMEMSGIVVVRSDCSVGGVRASLAKGGQFSAVTFHNDVFPPQEKVVTTAREHSRAALVLFKNAAVECEDWLFDLVIAVPAPPDVWSRWLGQAIADARKVHEHSRQLRQDCADGRDLSRSLSELLNQGLVSAADYDALFQGEPNGVMKRPGDDDVS